MNQAPADVMRLALVAVRSGRVSVRSRRTSPGNRHIVFPDYTERTSNMLLALLHKYGIEDIPKYDAAGRQVGTQKSFGSSTTPLSL